MSKLEDYSTPSGIILTLKKGSNQKLTKNFSSNEFDCKCTDSDCKVTKIDLALLNLLQDIRDAFGRISITSGFRCETHNKRIGGSTKSQHKLGTAADIVPIESTLKELQNDMLSTHKYAEELPMGLGLYNTFTHIDTRPVKAFWDFRKKK